MREIVIVSGKGGTGKTSLAAAFARLAAPVALADADVDAADLHLVLAAREIHRARFIGGRKAHIDAARCDGCGRCVDHCRFEALLLGDGAVRVDALACEGCGACALVCPSGAVELEPDASGSWMVSDTPRGPLVHARLDPGGENSGKLVSLVRDEARHRADAAGLGLLITDGPPGTGCAATAAITGADLVVAVTEPTPAARHDLLRVLDLARHFRVPVAVVVNKADLHPAFTRTLAGELEVGGVPVVGGLPYDDAFTTAQNQGVDVLSLAAPPIADAITTIWERIRSRLATTSPG